MLPKTLSILKKFGRNTLTGHDFIELCDANGIAVQITAKCKRGLYYFEDGEHNIVLSPKLSVEDRRFVGWHEFAHFLGNFVERRTITAFSTENPADRIEILADIFAKIALRPQDHKLSRPIDFVKMIMDGGRAAQARRGKK